MPTMISYSFLLLLAQVACQSVPKATLQPELAFPSCQIETFVATDAPAFSLPYQLDAPDRSFLMPPELLELSALSMGPDGQSLLTLQDEAGILYRLDAQTGRILESITFGKEGDFEGVEAVGNEVYCLRSSGTLRKLRLDDPSAAPVNLKNALDRSFDVEGLGAEPSRQRLLLACKSGSKDHPLQRPIFAFDLQKGQLDTVPVLCFTQASLLAFAQKRLTADKAAKIIDHFQANDFDFGPSGIAVDPLTGWWYVLSARGNLLLVVRPNGEILHLSRLKNKILPQPEGICFDAQGNLYLSSEGKDGAPASIHCFLKK